MKKLLSVIMAALMCFALAGCGIDGLEEAIINDVVDYITDTSEAATQEAQLDTSESTAQAAGEHITTPVATTTSAVTNATTTATTTSAVVTTTTKVTTTTAATTTTTPAAAPPEPTVEEEETLDPDGTYTTKDDVALYIHLYGCLPNNFITKKEAQALGWEGGSLEPYAPGMCIGGSYFGNYEGLLPEKNGREYTECDIDTLGKKSRGAKRIVFSNDGLIYYTDDHYESFTLLYGEE